MTLTLSLAVISFCGSSFAASSNDTNVSGAGFEAIESSEKVKQELMAQYGENKPIMDGDYDKSLAVRPLARKRKSAKRPASMFRARTACI